MNHSPSPSKEKTLGLLLPIALMTWPVIVFVTSLVGYGVLNLFLGDPASSRDPDIGRSIVNIILFTLGAGSVLLGLPSFIAGIVLLIIRGTKKNAKHQA